MTPRRFAFVLALLTVFGVVAILLFPAVQGPYSAVNGPVTALQSARASAGLRLAILHAGLNLVGMRLNSTPILLLCARCLPPPFRPQSSLDAQDLILRC